MKFLAILSPALLAFSAYAADPIKVMPPAQKMLQSDNGRFVFGQVSDWRSDQYMLDTQTGRLWMIGTKEHLDANGKPIPGSEFRIMRLVPYSALDDSLSQLPK